MRLALCDQIRLLRTPEAGLFPQDRVSDIEGITNFAFKKHCGACLVLNLVCVRTAGAIEVRVRLREAEGKLVSALVVRVAVDHLEPVQAVDIHSVVVAKRVRLHD